MKQFIKIRDNKDKLLISNLYRKLKYNKYGDSEKLKHNCFRIKHPKRYPIQRRVCGINKFLYPWTISYAHKHNKFLDRKKCPKLCISHLCGNGFSKKRKGVKWISKRGEQISLCIQPSHLVIEKNKDNRKRRKCHDCIRKFREYFKSDPAISTSGKLTIKKIKKIVRNKNITDFVVDVRCKHKNKKRCFIWYK